MANMTSISKYPRPFSTEEAASWLGLSERCLLQMARDGEIPAKKIGRQWRFSQDALAKYAGVVRA